MVLFTESFELSSLASSQLLLLLCTLNVYLIEASISDDTGEFCVNVYKLESWVK